MTLETLSEALRRLAEAGFVADLTVSGEHLHDLASGRDYEPAELRVIELVRFEGMSDPADEAMLLALAARDGGPVGTLTMPFGPEASSAEADLVRRLHRVVATDEDTSEHDSHDHVVAVLPGRAEAEAAIEELRDIGLGSDHLGVALRHGERTVFERDEDVDLVHDVKAGVVTGAGLGVLAGIALFAVALPGFGTLGVGGIAALGAASGFGGTMLGGYIGVASSSDEFDSHQELRHTDLEPNEVLLVACGHHHRRRVEAAMQRHGGRVLHPTDAADPAGH